MTERFALWPTKEYYMTDAKGVIYRSLDRHKVTVELCACDARVEIH